MNRKLFTISLTLSLILSFLAVTYARALSGGNWISGVKIQNLDNSNSANVNVDLYDLQGNPKYSITTTANGSPLAIPPGNSVEIYLPNFSQVAAGQYSAVISSSAEVGAIVTTTNYPYGLADSYNIMTPSMSVFVPYVYHGHNNWSTEIFVQNTSASQTASGTIVFSEPSSSPSYIDSGVHTKTINFNIPPGGTQAFDTSTSAYDDLGWFIGSATITSSVPVAVVANQTRLAGIGDVKGNVLISARGLSSADSGTKILLPSLYKNFSGVSGTWRSGIKIVNPSSDNPAQVTIRFKSDPGSISFEGTKELTVNANDSAEIYLPATTLTSPVGPIPDMFKGYAVITSDHPVVATVQHTNYESADGYGVAVGYAGFADGGSKISLPSLYMWPSGAGIWISGIKIQNYSSSGSATFDVYFTADPDSISRVNGTKRGIRLEPEQAIELYFGTMTLDEGGTIPSGWKGSAVIQGLSGAEELVATVIHTNYGRHVATMYTGILIR